MTIDRPRSAVDSLIPGFHGVRETLIRGAHAVQEVWIASKKRTGRAEEIIRMARERNIPVVFKDPAVFTRSFPGIPHQGIAAVTEGFHYERLERVVERAVQAGGYGLILVADHIADQGNLGALIRTAAFFGAHGLVIPEDRSAGVDPIVLKRSAGACFHIPVVRVVNIGRALAFLAKNEFWIIGASGEARTTIYQFDWKRHVALILGNEQKGLSRPARKACHEIVSIPARGAVESLNVSVSSGVVLAEIFRQRAS